MDRAKRASRARSHLRWMTAPLSVMARRSCLGVDISGNARSLLSCSRAEVAEGRARWSTTAVSP
eukprot:scaffold14940_cov200-Alexandrium_tamarense.AAC.9